MRRHHRVDRTPCQLAVTDFAASRGAHAAGFTDGVRREVVVQHEVRLHGAFQKIDELLVFAGAEGGNDQALGFTTGEECGTVRTRQNADFGRDRTDSRQVTSVDTGAGVEVLAVIPPEEFNHWIGVGDIMREEARERIHAHFEVFAKWMRDKQGVAPELVIREGEPVTEIMAQVQDDPEIGVLVLGAGTDKKGPGPLVTQLSKNSGTLTIPLTIVPGDLSKERLEAIT